MPKKKKENEDVGSPFEILSSMKDLMQSTFEQTEDDEGSSVFSRFLGGYSRALQTAAIPTVPRRDPLKTFAGKWLGRFAEAFNSISSKEETATSDTYSLPDKRKRLFSSANVARVLNYLYWPLFISGIAFIGWMLIDFFLRMTLSPSGYATMAQISGPIEGIVGPAAVGFWTNFLAIKMLFHPRRNNWIWWGLIPARREELVDALASGVSENLFSGPIVREYLKETGLLRNIITKMAIATDSVTREMEFRQELKDQIRQLVAGAVNRPETVAAVQETIGEVIDRWEGHGIGGWILKKVKPVLRPWVVDQVTQLLPDIPDSIDGVLDLIDPWLDRLPNQMLQGSAGIEEAAVGLLEHGMKVIDVQSIVRTQLNKMDEAQLEELLTGTVTSELVFIQTSGGIFGLIVALAVMYPILRPIFLLAGLAIWAMYAVSVEKKAKTPRNRVRG